MSVHDDLLQRRSRLSPAKRALLEQRLRGSVADSSTSRLLPPIQPVPRDRPLPLTLSQEYLWQAVRRLPRTSYFNTPMHIHLSGPLDHRALERCLNDLIQRHEALRTRFVTVDGQPAHEIAQEVSLELPLFDLSDLPEAERFAELHALAEIYTRWPLKLTDAPLLQAALLRLGPREHLLLVITHHIISDGWSIDVFVRDLHALYQSSTQRGAAESVGVLPPLGVQFADYAVWQRAMIETNAFAEQLRYWRQRLAGSTNFDWPVTLPPPTQRSFRYGYNVVALPSNVATALRQMSTQQGASLFMTFLAALQTMIYGYTGHRDIKVGTLVANRTQVEMERLIGYFINTVVLRSQFEATITFRDVLQQVRQSSLEGLMYQDVPVELVMDAVASEASHDRLFQVFFIFQSIAGSRIQDSALQIRSWTFSDPNRDYEIIPTSHDLWVEVKDEENELTLIVKYKLDLFDRAEGHALTERLLRVLEQAVPQLDAPLATWL